MANEKIHEYVKERIPGTITDEDELDIDSTDDAGSNWESARITMLNFVTYLKTKILSFYTTDGTMTGTREVTMASNDVRFTDGDVISRSGLNDQGFVIQDTGGNVKGALSYDVSESSAGLGLSNSLGVFFDAVDGIVRVTGQMYSLVPSDLVPAATTQEIDWNDGMNQIIDLDSATGDVTLTSINPIKGAVYFLEIKQGGTTLRDLIYPANWKWSNGGVELDVTQTLDAVDSIVLFYDGTNYLASFNQNFA